MEISVIVTIYNREKYLRECLDSLVNQTFDDFEVLMIDDGSTDSSRTIAEEYAKKDTRFKLTPSKHIGYPAAKNLGIDLAKGKYIIFLDSDDSAYPQWLGILYTVAENTGADITSCYYDEYYKDKAKEPDEEFYLKNPIRISESSFLKMHFLYYHLCSSYNWNKLVKKKIYKNITFKDQIALSDISEGYKIFDQANKVVHVHFPLVHYRRHLESIGEESSSLGLEYYKFRADVLEESGKFTWEHYPQSRCVVREMIINESRSMIRAVGKEAFEKEINRDFFKMVINSSPIRYMVM